MNKKILVVLTDFFGSVVLASIILILTYYLSPLHELFHALPCKLVGLSPQLSYFETICYGIQNKSHLIQFFYFMGPYIVYSILLIIGYFYAKKHFLVRYLLLIPSFDIIYNFFLSPHGSDFLFLSKNTYPNLIPFWISMAIGTFVVFFSAHIVFKFKMWKFKDMVMDFRKGERFLYLILINTMGFEVMNKLLSIKFILFILVLCFLSPAVISEETLFYERVDCEHKYVEEYIEKDTVLVIPDSEVIKGKALTFSDFVSSNKSSSFMAKNSNLFDVIAYFTFDVWGSITEEKEFGKIILNGSSEKISASCHDGENYGECSINQSTIKYHITKPELLVPKELNVLKKREVCCSNGTMNCRERKCIEPHAKKEGESYECDWECEFGLGEEGICKNPDGELCSKDVDCYSGECNFGGYCGPFVGCKNETQFNCKNIGCVTPHSRGYNKAYDCIEECESGYGNGKVCKIHPLYLSGIIAVISVLFYISIQIARTKRIKNEIKKYTARKEAIAKEEEELKKLIKLKNKKENEMNIINTKTKEGRKKLKNLEQIHIAIKDKRADIREEEKKLEEEHTKVCKSKILGWGVYEWRNPRREYYPCYVNDGVKTDTLIHLEQARNKIFEQWRGWFRDHYSGKEFEDLKVHHIDGSKDNYYWKNLVVISKTEHDRINHGNIIDRKSGIKELYSVNIKQPHLMELDEYKD